MVTHGNCSAQRFGNFKQNTRAPASPKGGPRSYAHGILWGGGARGDAYIMATKTGQDVFTTRMAPR
eukprot:553652-Pyramimonas_sp.AAC.1